MFISNAYAQAATQQGAANSGLDALLGPNILMIVMIVIVFYFLVFRPQMQARKRHMEMLAALKKGDIVVTSGGLIGKVKSLQDDEVRVELAPNVDVRVVRGTIAEVRGKTDPAPANDSKPAAAE